MKLESFDRQCVRITDREENVFEGICEYCSGAYNEHEYGNSEEDVHIVRMLSCIQDYLLSSRTKSKLDCNTPINKEAVTSKEIIEALDELLGITTDEKIKKMAKQLKEKLLK